MLGELLHQVELDLLDLRQPLPLVGQQVVHLLVQVADLHLGFQVDLVVVFGAQAVA